MTGHLAEAEDAVQEAYARVWQRWHSYGGLENPEAWVRVVAYRIAVSAWRKSVNRLVAQRRATSGGHAPALGPEHVALVEALRRIPPDQRRVIVLHHLVGLSVDEVAAEIGISAGTVKSRLARGRAALALGLSEAAPPGADSSAATTRSGKERSQHV